MEKNREFTLKFLDNLFKILEIRGISVSDFEKDCGLSPGYISRCRNGGKSLSIDSVGIMLTKFEIKPYLMLDPNLADKLVLGELMIRRKEISDEINEIQERIRKS